MSHAFAASLFEYYSDEGMMSTAAWAAKVMRKMDWTQRHHTWKVCICNKPKRFRDMVAAYFSPDELLAGSSTGLSPPVIIALAGKLKRQTYIESYFAKRPRTT